MIERIKIAGWPSGLARGVPQAPRTASEARELARRLNREEARKRADRDTENAARLKAARAPQASTGRPSAKTSTPRIDIAAVYARRNRPRAELPAERASACSASCRVFDDGQREEPCSASCQLKDALEGGDEPAGRLNVASVYAARRRSTPSGSSGAPARVAAPSSPRGGAR